MADQADALSTLQARNAYLEAQLAQYRDALEHMHQGLCVFDEHGTITLCNTRYAEILHLPAGSVRPGLTGGDVVRLGIAAGHYQEGRQLEDIRAEIRSQLTAAEGGPVMLAREGFCYGVRQRVTPTGHVVTTCEDITGQVKAQEALRESETRLRAILDAMPDCVKIFDASGKLVYINPMGLELLQSPDLESLSQPGYLPVPAEYFEEVLGVHNRVIGGETVVWLYEVVGLRGRRRHVEAHSVPFRLPEGGEAHMCISRDISDRKEADDALRLSEERLRLVHEATGLADFEVGADGVAVLSDAFVEQHGLPMGTRELQHAELLRLVHPEDREEVRQAIQRSVESSDTFQCEFRIVRPDSGDVRWISSYSKTKRDASGKAVRTIGAHLDITSHKRTDEALRESEERFRLAAEAAGLGVWDYDNAVERREWSGRLREILGIDKDADATLELAEACIDPNDRGRFRHRLASMREGRLERFEDTFRISRLDDGASRWIVVNGWRTDKADRRLPRIIMTVRDVTDEKTAEERIRWTATHDPLTRLANRTLFHEKLDAAIQVAASDGGAVGLVLLDMDHFKQINDTLGHDAGDMLLKLFAGRLRGIVRTADTVARLGGDEFAIVMPDCAGEHSVLHLSRSIQERLREPFIHQGRLLDCRVSIGATLFPMHGDTPEELLKNADIALYAAKKAGRATVSLFEPHMRGEVQQQNAMVQLARDALNDDRVIPYYQPKFDLASGSVIGFEALLRWRTPRGEIGTPAGIEAAFEDLEVASAISDRMIERVIADMRTWLDKGIQFHSVAINASAAEFRSDHFAERLLERLSNARIPTRCLQLEVTETVFLGRGAEYVHRALGLLNARGVQIALDDFGTGYASLRHLKQFPVDSIKIDRSFVHDMLADSGNEAIIGAVVNLGRSLGIQVIAEGIETEAEAARLLELGCAYGQGFLYAKPVAARRVPAILARTAAPARKLDRALRLVAAAS